MEYSLADKIIHHSTMTKAIQHLFLEHPESVGESYAEHLRFASSFGWKLLIASLAAFAHAIVPGLFKQTASNAIIEMHGKVANRGR